LLKEDSQVVKKDSLAVKFFKGFVRVHISLYQLVKGRGLIGKHTILVTTIGRKSGQPRTRPLYAVKDGNDYIVLASFGGSPQHPDWYLNLQANPQVTIQDRNKTLSTIASTVEDEAERERLWSKMTAIYAGYNDYQQRTERKIPVVRLSPQSA